MPEKQMRGEVFVWTDDGRPAAVINVFQMDEGNGPQEFHEFCSLASSGLTTTNAANRNWSPASPQVTMTTVPDAPLPAKNARQRFTQVRELAARFTCQKTNRKGDVQTLRLLSQPLTRYESQTHGVVDGAMFTFVEATDPEAFLLLEARPADGRLQWHFGFARMASVQMQASRDNKNVWEVETLPFDGYRNRPDLPYTLPDLALIGQFRIELQVSSCGIAVAAHASRCPNHFVIQTHLAVTAGHSGQCVMPTRLTIDWLRFNQHE